MFAVRPWRIEGEVIKWIALLVVAAGLALLATRAASGGDLGANREPALLPVGTAQLARPMDATRIVQDDLNAELWKILHQHQAGLPDEALEAWQEVTLPCETQVWKHVAMAMANLQLGQLDAAAEQLAMAEQLEPQNPLVHYYLAILRLDEARLAREWYDAIGPVTVRLATYRPHGITPNTRSMYEFHAMREFEEAIAHAGHLDRQQVLAPVAYPSYPVVTIVPPATVNDLLVALGAERFEGQAHNMLGALCLDRGACEQAEEHMDAAGAAGLTVAFGYRDLGAAYEQEGCYSDAFRAYLKSIGHDPGVVQPLRHALENVGRAMLDR